VCGILTVLVAALDMKTSLLGKSLHMLLFALAPAIRPRMVIAVQPQDLQPVPDVNLRVGQVRFFTYFVSCFFDGDLSFISILLVLWPLWPFVLIFSLGSPLL
jgi:hypothetical protein